MQRQPVIHRFRRLTECGRVSELPVSGRLLGCMRSHGVPNFPDPDSSGELPKDRRAALRGQHLPVPGRPSKPASTCSRQRGSLQQQEHQCMQNSDCPPALVQQMMTGDLKLARCMRSHGVPNFPDPTNGGSEWPRFQYH